jgi:hypothetical protein
MIALYMDENVEGQIVRGLRARGVDVLTAEEDGYRETADTDLLNRATALNRVAFSRDDDFLREATTRHRAGESFGGVIYAHKLYVSLGECIADLEYLAVVGDAADFTDRVYFLPL